MSLPDSSRKPDPIEKDFLDALQRLLEGKPLHKTLKASAKAGKLKINTVNVALEAGRSRTLIAMEDCRYPKVREAIKLAQGGKKALPTTYTQLIENLRADLATLKAEKRLLETTMAAHVLARRKAEVSARRDAAEAARLRKAVVELEKIAHLPQPQQDEAMSRLILIRGQPGSGKTTKAKTYQNQGYQHFEADMFYEVDGQYQFVEERLPEAHAWCLQQTRDALAAGEHVVVANVFATIEDVTPYTELGFDYQIIEATRKGKSVHPVPAAVLKRMKDAWVPTDVLLDRLKLKSPARSKVTRIHSSKKDK
jgi:predicted kinase